MSKSILMVTPSEVHNDAKAQPITRGWVMSGEPVTQTKSLGRSHDWTSNIVIWECTAGSFEWHYSQDEMLVIISGEAYIDNGNNTERRLIPGDLAYFPSGVSAKWRVPRYVKKVAIVRETLWRPLGFLLKGFKKLLRLLHLSGSSPF